jgi:hypothetical protein
MPAFKIAFCLEYRCGRRRAERQHSEHQQERRLATHSCIHWISPEKFLIASV